MKNYIVSENQLQFLIETESSVSSLTVKGSKLIKKEYPYRGDYIFINSPKEISDLDGSVKGQLTGELLKTLINNNGTLYIKVDDIEFEISFTSNLRECGEVKLTTLKSLSIPFNCLNERDKVIIDGYIDKDDLSDDKILDKVEELISTDVSRESIFNKIKYLGNWIYRDYGLGLQHVIDNILNPLKTNVPTKLQIKFREGAVTLKNAKKISEEKYEEFSNQLSNRKLIYDNDGNWDILNKLNTNYYELSKIITDYLFDRNETILIDRLNLIPVNNIDDIKWILIKIKPKLSKYIDDLFLDGKLKTYTNFIRKTSEKGSISENKVKKSLEKLNYVVLYEGGDGDLIDMKFSVDLIVKTPLGDIKTIQIKSNEKQVSDFLKEVEKGFHRAVDIIIHPEGDRFITYDIKSNKRSSFKSIE
jgi:hypothetical protein